MLDVTTLGGPGSGNFGHVGRPGQVGGSATARITSRADLSEHEERLLSNWEWPDASPVPSGIDYETLRDPSTASGAAMTQLLEKMPVHEGRTYRGLSLESEEDFNRLLKAETYEFTKHSSSSKEFETALLFANTASVYGKPVIFDMTGRGRDINGFLDKELQATQEVVITAGTRYKVHGWRTEKFYNENYTIVTLSEVK